MTREHHIYTRQLDPQERSSLSVLAGVLERQTAELQAAYQPWLALEVADAEDGWVLLVGRRP